MSDTLTQTHWLETARILIYLRAKQRETPEVWNSLSEQAKAEAVAEETMRYFKERGHEVVSE